MLGYMKSVLTTIILALAFIPTAIAQQPDASTAQRAGSDFVTEKGFKSKVFDVKYRDADSVARVLRQLGSGFKGASMAANDEFKTITVRDFPENLATIEEALKRLDTPGTPRPNIELHMHVLRASNASGYVTPPTREIPTELRDVLKQLRETLSFKNYDLAASVVQRLTETPRGLRGKGLAEISWAPTPAAAVNVPYEYLINQVSLVPTSSGVPIIQIGEFTFNTGVTPQSPVDNRTQVQTALNLRDGEKVVVGTATMGDRALVIVLSAKLLN
ncbi:MAG TPA: secretin N-terminal domain-containing protein [Pyrinomonadaceae bacterium]|nr:secretin N-terminal domain-containing protein [Pyrinomonadaceae bacterium]